MSSDRFPTDSCVSRSQTSVNDHLNEARLSWYKRLLASRKRFHKANSHTLFSIPTESATRKRARFCWQLQAMDEVRTATRDTLSRPPPSGRSTATFAPRTQRAHVYVRRHTLSRTSRPLRGRDLVTSLVDRLGPFSARAAPSGLRHWQGQDDRPFRLSPRNGLLLWPGIDRQPRDRNCDKFSLRDATRFRSVFLQHASSSSAFT